jgi:HJR/Mrr/RecB family endonuclease
LLDIASGLLRPGPAWLREGSSAQNRASSTAPATRDSIYTLTPRKFEELIADLLADLGCDVELTPATRDGGKDILAYMTTPHGKLLCLVEAKKHRRDRPVGVELVRQLYGTLTDADASSAMLVTTSSFSKEAKAFRRDISTSLLSATTRTSSSGSKTTRRTKASDENSALSNNSYARDRRDFNRC